jgi:hypothetical protein
LLLFFSGVKAEHSLTLFKEKLSILILLLDPNIWCISSGITTKLGPDTIFVLAFFLNSRFVRVVGISEVVIDKFCLISYKLTSKWRIVFIY